MKWHIKIVFGTAIVIGFLSVTSIILYSILGAGLQRTLMFWLIVASAYTSLGGLFWALYSVYRYHREIGSQLEEISKFGDTQLQHLDPRFTNQIGHISADAFSRFNDLSHCKQERLIRMTERFFNSLFEKIEGMPEEKPPRKERKNA